MYVLMWGLTQTFMAYRGSVTLIKVHALKQKKFDFRIWTLSFLNCCYQLPYRSDTHRMFKIGGHTHTELYVLHRQLQTVAHLLSPTQQHLCRCIVRITD